jgi:cobalt/nickel transport system ATP-binding protein
VVENGAGGKDRVSSATIRLNGVEVVRPGDLNQRVERVEKEVSLQGVGMVFQDPDDQLFMPTVFDDVAFGPLNLGFPPETVAERVTEALECVDALHLRDRPPYKLSGGEKRAVAIASILSMSPDILVMDEPSTGLDPRARRLLIEQLRSFHHTKIIATHDLDLVLDLCDRTIVLHDGRVTADGPTLEIFGNAELLAESHLEKPLRMQGCPVCGGIA